MVLRKGTPRSFVRSPHKDVRRSLPNVLVDFILLLFYFSITSMSLNFTSDLYPRCSSHAPRRMPFEDCELISRTQCYFGPCRTFQLDLKRSRRNARRKFYNNTRARVGHYREVHCNIR